MSTCPLFSARVTVRFSDKLVLHEVAVTIERGEIFGLIGHSGCGKSTFALAALNLVEFVNGRITGHVELEGHDLLQMSSRQLRRLRGNEIALVLQSPRSSLNPALKLRTHFEESFRAHSNGRRTAMRDAIDRALADVCLTPDILDRRVSQISVGQAQRAVIALALLHSPKLLVADEPTSALDPVNQLEINDLFRRLANERNISILYISHDLISVHSICDRVAIMDAGRIVETGNSAELFDAPQHPVTEALTRSARNLLARRQTV